MSKRSEQSVYEFEEFRLDAAHSMLYRNGEEISLPPKAVETLLALVVRHGEILSKDELMEIVWADSIVEESNLSQYLHLLRKTLGETRDGKPFIETLRRRGYRFIADVSIVESIKEEQRRARQKTVSDDRNVTIEQPITDARSGLQDNSKLIGREKELEAIARLMSSGVRLLTLTGVGGVGKTTLARSVADYLRDDFADGVFFVELASVADPQLVISTIATSLGVKEASGKPILEVLLEVLKDHLRERRMVLVIDNFEHVISAAAQIAKLLNATDNLKILITSRVFLHLSAELEFVVPPLAVPSEAALDGYGPVTDEGDLHVSKPGSGFLDDLQKYSAVKLFVERAQNTNPNFALTNENARSIAHICSRLDGLPLAIELAAARIKVMPPDAILARLNSQLKLLTGGAIDLPTRQQTMRGTIAWSYDLLEEKEKLLFGRLSVFAGGFTLDAAETIAGETAVTGKKKARTIKAAKNNAALPEQGWRRTTDVIDGITSLVQQNLLVSMERTGGHRRFRMLEVVREFALESLAESGELEFICRRHAEYFLALGEKAEPFLQAAQSAEWLKRLEEEHDNMRFALGWTGRNDRKLGQRLASSIWRFWLLHGHIREGCEHLDLFLKWGNSDAGSETRTKMLLAAGFLNRLKGNFELARSLAEDGLALARQRGDKKSIAFSLYQLGLLALDGDVSRAGRLFEEGLSYAGDSGDKQLLALLLNGLGEFLRSQNDYERAADLYAQALTLNREMGDLYRQATNLVNLGATALSQEDLHAAGSFYREGLRISSNMSDVRGAIYCLEGMAGAYWAERDHERAVLLLGAATASREAMSLPIEPADRLPYDQCFALVSGLLTEKEFAELLEVGRKMKLDEAVTLALEERPLLEQFRKKQFPA